MKQIEIRYAKSQLSKKDRDRLERQSPEERKKIHDILKANCANVLHFKKDLD